MLIGLDYGPPASESCPHTYTICNPGVRAAMAQGWLASSRAGWPSVHGLTAGAYASLPPFIDKHYRVMRLELRGCAAHGVRQNAKLTDVAQYLFSRTLPKLLSTLALLVYGTILISLCMYGMFSCSLFVKELVCTWNARRG